ncbi:MAG: response regulator [Dongiaceae bacterium]
MQKMAERKKELDLSRLNVLVVDDNRNMLHLMRTVLNGLRIKNIRAVSDAAEAFKEMRHFPADVVFVDWMMEPLDGCDFTRLVRTAKDSPNPNVPIIMLTGHTEEWRVIQARDVGVTQFLAKPVSARALYTRIVSVIENPLPLNRHEKPTTPAPETAAAKDDQPLAELGTALTPDEVDALLRS